MSFNPDFVAIGEAFVSHFYSAFDVNDPNQRVQALSGLYDPENSYMTFEGVQVKGRDAILQKFSVCSAARVIYEIYITHIPGPNLP